MRKWEYYEYIVDIGVCGYGLMLEEVFEVVVFGFFDVMVNVKKVEFKECREVEVEEEDFEVFLYSFFEEFLVFYDMEGLVFGDVKVWIEKIENGYKFKVKVCGEVFNLEKYELKEEVKVIMYYDMKIEKFFDGRWMV